MNTEIKFKGKSRLGLNPWVCGFFLENENEDRFIAFNTEGNEFQLIPIEYESLCRFTGIVDDSEIDIYQGDIIIDIVGNKHEVQWNDDTCKFQLSNGEDFNDGDNYSSYKCIVGNIIDNPEILNR